MPVTDANFKHFSEYENILVVDHEGKIVFYDVADLNILKAIGVRPEEFLGKYITTLYKNLNVENSTFMQVLRTGEAVCHAKQEVVTANGSTIFMNNSTYPLIENDRVVGAVEFSKNYFSKENIYLVDKHAAHPLYRKNNTIFTLDDMITKNSRMKVVKEKFEKAAKTNSTVMITGQTGTGKEMVAQSIHNASDRYEKPFISLNCGAVPESLMESILFGTVKGSFTGAVDTPGLFEQAQEGTLFLDEINSLSMMMQVKLLKAVEEKTIRRIGGTKNIHLDLRIISATNEPPELLLRERRIREDLFYRLGVVQIDLPSLSERREDIDLLTNYYISFYNSVMNLNVDGIDEEVIKVFNQYEWPGNIRELRNAIETAYNNLSSNRITLEDIPERIKRKETVVDSSLIKTGDKLKQKVERFEKELIEQEWLASGKKLAKSARILGLSKQTLKYKLEKYQIK